MSPIIDYTLSRYCNECLNDNICLSVTVLTSLVLQPSFFIHTTCSSTAPWMARIPINCLSLLFMELLESLILNEIKLNLFNRANDSCYFFTESSYDNNQFLLIVYNSLIIIMTYLHFITSPSFSSSCSIIQLLWQSLYGIVKYRSESCYLS
jgi:hypothetical protein